MHQPLIPFDGLLKGESELSREYFQHSRDMGRVGSRPATLVTHRRNRSHKIAQKIAKKFLSKLALLRKPKCHRAPSAPSRVDYEPQKSF